MAKAKRTPEEIEQELPILTSVGFNKMDGLWRVYTLRTQGTKVLSVELTEGDTRFIALEEFKKIAVREFIDKEAN